LHKNHIAIIELYGYKGGNIMGVLKKKIFGLSIPILIISLIALLNISSISSFAEPDYYGDEDDDLAPVPGETLPAMGQFGSHRGVEGWEDGEYEGDPSLYISPEDRESGHFYYKESMFTVFGFSYDYIKEKNKYTVSFQIKGEVSPKVVFYIDGKKVGATTKSRRRNDGYHYREVEITKKPDKKLKKKILKNWRHVKIKAVVTPINPDEYKTTTFLLDTGR
jgi:hypothetical protein